jgi:hypothetical protein
VLALLYFLTLSLNKISSLLLRDYALLLKNQTERQAKPVEEQDLKLIFNAIYSGKCLAFLGAGACTAFRKNDRDDEPGLPDRRRTGQVAGGKVPIHQRHDV